MSFVKKLFAVAKGILKRISRRLKYEIKKTGAAISVPFRYCYNDIFKKTPLTDYDEAVKKIGEIWSDNGKLCTDIENPETDSSLDLSIVIPVYNVGEFLEICIESILGQVTEYSYKIIIVDDGSTDNTPDILKKYYTDSRFIIMYQQNQGQSVARNNALKKCNGKYLMFVDGDDFLCPNAIQSLMDTAVKNGCDIAEGGVQYIMSNKNLSDCTETMGFKPEKTRFYKYGETPEFVLTSNGYSPAKVFKRELWNDVRFPENYIFEDIINKFILRRISEKYAKINSIVYYYRWRPDSSSHSRKDYRQLDCLWVIDRVVSMHRSLGLPNDNVYDFLLMNHICVLTPMICNNYPPEIQRSAFAIIRKYLPESKDFLKYTPLILKLMYSAVKKGNLNNWLMLGKIDAKYKFLKKYREVN